MGEEQEIKSFHIDILEQVANAIIDRYKLAEGISDKAAILAIAKNEYRKKMEDQQSDKGRVTRGNLIENATSSIKDHIIPNLSQNNLPLFVTLSFPPVEGMGTIIERNVDTTTPSAPRERRTYAPPLQAREIPQRNYQDQTSNVGATLDIPYMERIFNQAISKNPLLPDRDEAEIRNEAIKIFKRNFTDFLEEYEEISPEDERRIITSTLVEVLAKNVQNRGHMDLKFEPRAGENPELTITQQLSILDIEPGEGETFAPHDAHSPRYGDPSKTNKGSQGEIRASKLAEGFAQGEQDIRQKASETRRIEEKKTESWRIDPEFKEELRKKHAMQYRIIKELSERQKNNMGDEEYNRLEKEVTEKVEQEIKDEEERLKRDGGQFTTTPEEEIEFEIYYQYAVANPELDSQDKTRIYLEKEFKGGRKGTTQAINSIIRAPKRKTIVETEVPVNKRPSRLKSLVALVAGVALGIGGTSALITTDAKLKKQKENAKAERDQTKKQYDEAVAERDKAVKAQEGMVPKEKYDNTIKEKDEAVAERDEAIVKNKELEEKVADAQGVAGSRVSKDDYDKAIAERDEAVEAAKGMVPRSQYDELLARNKELEKILAERTDKKDPVAQQPTEQPKPTDPSKKENPYERALRDALDESNSTSAIEYAKKADAFYKKQIEQIREEQKKGEGFYEKKDEKPSEAPKK